MSKSSISGSTLLFAALALTLINVAKPLVVDDGAYYKYARHIASHPTDPYGFELFWYEEPEPANRVLAPPGLPYWWAAGIALFGDRPAAWKLWLFPFAWLLVRSLARLIERMAPRHGSALLLLVICSPAILPSFNLMLDIPALALGLFAMTLALQAAERARGGGLALLAGALAGLAMQTKYNAVVPLAASLLYMLLLRRVGRAVVLCAGALVIFLGWEALVVVRYGESHLVNGVRLIATLPAGSASQWFFSILCLLGATSSAAALLALSALRTSPLWIAVIAVEVASVMVLVAWLPPEATGSMAPLYPQLGALGRGEVLLALTGVLVAATLAGCLWSGPVARLRDHRSAQGLWVALEDPAIRHDLFLLAWLLTEVLGLFLLSPFPAVRRVMGLYVVSVLLAGRWAGLAGTTAGAMRGIAAFGACLGLVFAVADLGDARARRRGMADMQAELASLGAGADGETIWFVGHWAFQYYAERMGLRPLVPDASRPERGDWLVIPSGVHRQQLAEFGSEVEEVTRVTAVGSWPWSTLPGSYVGFRPIRPQPRAQVVIRIHRVLEDFVPLGR